MYRKCFKLHDYMCPSRGVLTSMPMLQVTGQYQIPQVEQSLLSINKSHSISRHTGIHLPKECLPCHR